MSTKSRTTLALTSQHGPSSCRPTSWWSGRLSLVVLRRGRRSVRCPRLRRSRPPCRRARSAAVSVIGRVRCSSRAWTHSARPPLISPESCTASGAWRRHSGSPTQPTEFARDASGAATGASPRRLPLRGPLRRPVQACIHEHRAGFHVSGRRGHHQMDCDTLRCSISVPEHWTCNFLNSGRCVPI